METRDNFKEIYDPELARLFRMSETDSNHRVLPLLVSYVANANKHYLNRIAALAKVDILVLGRMEEDYGMEDLLRMSVDFMDQVLN